MSGTRVSIEYRKLGTDFDPGVLLELLLTEGVSDFNWVPEDHVREHFAGLAKGSTDVWGAFAGSELVGLITSQLGGQFRGGADPAPVGTAEIGEFVVASGFRGHGIGRALARTAAREVFQTYSPSQAGELYVMVHAENATSKRAFMSAGFKPLLTFEDPHRRRRTSVLRIRRPLTVVGIQSGNAVDGIDVCVAEFSEPKRTGLDSRDVEELQYTVKAFGVIPWSAEGRAMVLKLRDGQCSAAEYAKGNYAIGENLAEAARAVLAENDISLASVDLVSSHGQSILGHPHWESGELAVIANRLGKTTVGDFRPADVAAGGNGSPCTCTYDALMLRPPAGSPWRICINIGGTTSVTFCPPLGSTELPRGLDPGIGVFFMDLHAQLVDPGSAYDDEGRLARSGTPHETLLENMLQHPHFLRTQLPISIGTEDFSRALFSDWHRQSLELNCSPADFQATLTELTARSLALACQRFGPTGGSTDVIVRGQARKNLYFMERLHANLCESMGVSIDRLGTLGDLGLDEDSWETAMYAMFGFLCFTGLHAFVPSCTGAEKSVISGKICPGENFVDLNLGFDEVSQT